MKVAVGASLFTKWYVQINSGQMRCVLMITCNTTCNAATLRGPDSYRDQGDRRTVVLHKQLIRIIGRLLSVVCCLFIFKPWRS
jgi:hypothetical protein